MSTAIQTKYKGIEYRSRLEARWASFMESIKWDFTYEPFDGKGYIPDFIIHGNMPLFIEVKPATTMQEYMEPCDKITNGLAAFSHDVLIVGATPFVEYLHGAYGEIGGGLLGEFWDGADGLTGRDWAGGGWHRCTICNLISVHHEIHSYASRICGHYDGGGNLAEPPITQMKTLWADACNDVKWRGTSK